MNDTLTHDTVSASSQISPLLTIAEVCTVLRITRWSVYQLINNRRLKTVRIGRRRLVAAADLAAYIEELRAEEPGDGR